MGKRRLRSIKRFLFRPNKNPEALARGIGIGVFVGFLPSIGFQIILAVLLAGGLGGNRIAAAAGTFVTNPFTAIPISAFSLWLGDLILPGTRLSSLNMHDFSLKFIYESAGTLGLSFLVGCFVLALIGGGASYLAVRLLNSLRLRDLKA